MTTQADDLAARFEAERGRLRSVAYRMLGSLNEAEDAVQEGWLRLQRADADDVRNLSGWLTTVVGRICLDMLRARSTRREEPFEVESGDEVRLPDPVVRPADPVHEAELADSVGLALLVVLDTLAPAERLAFVLHDMFAVPFEDLAPIVERTPAATRQLASRARRRVQGQAPAPDTDIARQRVVVDAWLAASRAGDFEALLELLDPDVLLRVDQGPGAASLLMRGALEVAGQAALYGRMAPVTFPAFVGDSLGMVSVPNGKIATIGAFTFRDGKVVGVDIITDPARIAALNIDWPEA
ncbi:sigma-70 family RNA polymerase sigma factor [Streptomyces sp. VRA16 Mangrove soil]|uniref:sigma-70 family RNA polymerase sigma factor n=1 Tax=Streptomyces sp. VRA16 Mangrove soil TaxID=2817434 RepID=UPI001A9FAB9E|nr:sigma-70 family RNA polymerase sigma factor [Streptomyces sp. VRA16 Mangrove soil]MBO1333767.1 sigma-70 family RNA polymerase sigma factor [Streptomyces sp. VRA16 Mangrove soil]